MTAPLGIRLHYDFSPKEQRGAELDHPLFELLAAVIAAGSIRHAAQVLGCSYRHAWGALKQWEQTLGEPLIVWSQGQRARPTPFAERLLWAERRARTRMQPHIEALRSNLAGVLADAHDERQQLLTMRARARRSAHSRRSANSVGRARWPCDQTINGSPSVCSHRLSAPHT